MTLCNAKLDSSFGTSHTLCGWHGKQEASEPFGIRALVLLILSTAGTVNRKLLSHAQPLLGENEYGEAVVREVGGYILRAY